MSTRWPFSWNGGYRQRFRHIGGAPARAKFARSRATSMGPEGIDPATRGSPSVAHSIRRRGRRTQRSRRPFRGSAGLPTLVRTEGRARNRVRRWASGFLTAAAQDKPSMRVAQRTRLFGVANRGGKRGLPRGRYRVTNCSLLDGVSPLTSDWTFCLMQRSDLSR